MDRERKVIKQWMLEYIVRNVIHTVFDTNVRTFPMGIHSVIQKVAITIKQYENRATSAELNSQI